MIKNKFVNLFSVGILALNFYRVSNVNLSTATASPTAVPIKLIKTGTISGLKVVTFKNINKRGELPNVKVVSVDANSIIVDNGGTSVKIDLVTNTHFRREFWGKSDVSEISVGDTLNVIGRWKNEEKTEITAALVRDLSIQRRNGVFFGNVKAVTDSGFVMTTIHRSDETVVLNLSSKLIGRNGVAITRDDISVGDRVRVGGLWNNNKFTITEVNEVKDFNLPPHATPEAPTK